MRKRRPEGLKTGFAVVLAVLSVSCASPRPSASPFEGGTRAETTSITIENGHSQDMRVFLFRNGTRIPLGRVAGLDRRTLELPPAALAPGGSLWFTAEPIPSGPPHRSSEVLLSPGQRVVFTLAASRNLSRIRVQ